MTTREQIIALRNECDEFAEQTLQCKGEFHPDFHTVSDERFYTIAYEAGAASRDVEIAQLNKEAAEKFSALAKERDQLTEAYEAGKRDAIPEGWVLVPKEILDRFPETDPRNYDHDDVCSLNDWGVELVLAAAPKGEE